MKNIEIVQVEGAEVSTKIVAEAITKMAEAAQALYKSGLNEKAMVLLISDASGVSRRDVKCVLANLYHLKSSYLAQPKAATK